MFEKEKLEVIKTGKQLDRYGLISLAGGNVSARMPDGNILVTASGMLYDDMVPDDVLLMTTGGEIVQGTRKPSSDTEGLLYIFRQRPDVMAVIHTHQPYATAISLIQDVFRADLTTLGNACAGSVNVAPYAPPGSLAMGEDTVKYIGDALAVILAHHGVMTIGSSIKQALNAAVYLEECAKAYLAAAAVAPSRKLNDAQIRQAVEVYKYVGQGTEAAPEELSRRID